MLPWSIHDGKTGILVDVDESKFLASRNASDRSLATGERYIVRSPTRALVFDTNRDPKPLTLGETAKARAVIIRHRQYGRRA